MRMIVAFAAASYLFVQGPALGQSVPGEIIDTNRRFSEAVNRGDGGAIAALYTEGASLLPPGSPLTTGRASIRQFWEGSVTAGLRNLTMQPQSFESWGEAGREIGRFTSEMADPTGRVRPYKGNYLLIWKKVGGEWRIDADIWNTDE